MAKDLVYGYDPEGVNEVIDESSKSDSFIALREVHWTPDGQYKLDLRKYIVKDGSEIPMKGLSFFTESGPHTLVETMAVYGFGDTKKVINSLIGRDNFISSLAKVTSDSRETFIGKLQSEYAKIDEAEPTVDAREMLNQLL